LFSEGEFFSVLKFSEPDQEASVAMIVSLFSAVARVQAIGIITFFYGETVTKHGFVHVVNFVSG